MKIKRGLSIFLVICITFCVAQIGFYKLAATAAGTKTIYVSKSGKDATGYGTNAKPYKTVEYAITKAKSSNPEKIDVRIKDEGEFDFETEFSGELLIEGYKTDSAELKIVSNRNLETQSTKTCMLKSNLVFSNIKLLSALDTQGSPLKYSLITQGKKLIFGEGTSFDQNSFGILAGRANEYGTETSDQQVTVEDATFSGEKNLSSGLEIAVGLLPEKNTTDCSNPLGKIDIDIKSGDVKKVSFLDTNTVYGDDVTISWFADLKSDEQEAVTFENENNSAFKKSLQIIMNNGAISSNIGDSVRNATADGGKWIILGNKDYSYLETTELPGKFKVIGDLNVKATNTKASNEVYFSEESDADGVKYLDLSNKPGEYSVSALITSDFSATIYVSSSGNDETGKGTQLKPFATIAKAEEVIEASDIDSGEIILLTNMKLTSAPHTKMITIRGNTGNENLTQPHSTISVGGPTTFKDFNINDTVSHISNGNEVIYDNITMSGSYGTIYFGNVDSSVTTDNNITINGLGQASWHGANVRVGPGTRQGIMNSNLNIVVNNGYFNQFWVFEGTYNGDVNITFNGGTVYGGDPFLDPYTDYVTTYNGAYQLILNNGFSPSKISPSVSSIEAGNGKWLMYSDKSGGTLSMTDTPGTFAVDGGKTAVAKERNSKITYFSRNKTLTVPVGVYDVTYIDEDPKDNFLSLYHKGPDEASFVQKVSLEKGKTYNISFDYIDGFEQLDKNIVLSVLDPQGNKVYSADNGSISLISEDPYNFHRTYSFVHNLDSGEYSIGFSMNGDYSFAVTNLNLFTSDNTETNLLKNGNFKNYLNNWIINGYSPYNEGICKSVIGNSEFLASAQYFSNNNYFDKSAFSASDGLGTKNMLYIENYSGYRTILQRFYKIIKPGTKYAFECSISSAIDYKLNVRQTGDRVAIYKLDPEKTVEVEAETELGTVNYKRAYYEFTMPNTVENQIFVGFEFASGQTAIIFDLKLYEIEDPEKTNLLVNPDFEEGLDEWIWGWSVWYNHDADSSGLLEWKGDTGTLILKKYDYKNLVTYFDDRYFIDGTWWDEKDVAEPELGYAEVSGVLKDNDGNVMSTVAIAFVSDDYELSGKTDSKGEFNFVYVPEGDYNLYVFDSSGEEIYITNLILLKDGKYKLDIVCDISDLDLSDYEEDDYYDDSDDYSEELDDLEYDAESNTPLGVIKGTVYTPDKKIVSGLKLYLSNGATVVTDENGSFEFAALRAGEYKIGLKHKGKMYVLKTLKLQDNTIVTAKIKYDIQEVQVDNSTAGMPVWVWLLISAGGLLIMAAVVVIVLILRKKRISNVSI